MIYTKHQTGSKRRFAWIYQSKRWKALRAKLFNERGESCESCRSIGELQIHHRVPVSQGGEIFDESNLVILCRSCHLDAHKIIERQKMKPWVRRLYDLVDRPVVPREQYLTHTPRRA